MERPIERRANHVRTFHFPLSTINPRQARLVLLLVLVTAGCASSPHRVSQTIVSPPSAAGTFIRPIQTIVVDAGHGGHDPGASYYGLREKDLALDISRRLTAVLRAAGLSVTMSRDRDQFIPLSQRPGLANRLEVDLFVSVHINANRKRHVDGIEVYYPRESVLTGSAGLPPFIRPVEVSMPTMTIRQILWDLALARTRGVSAQLALEICRTMRDRLGVRCRGVRGARFVVLREAWMPSVLVEVGYVSNRQEASRLATASYRQAIAEAIAEGILSYIRELGLQHI